MRCAAESLAAAGRNLRDRIVLPNCGGKVGTASRSSGRSPRTEEVALLRLVGVVTLVEMPSEVRSFLPRGEKDGGLVTVAKDLERLSEAVAECGREKTHLSIWAEVLLSSLGAALSVGVGHWGEVTGRGDGAS